MKKSIGIGLTSVALSTGAMISPIETLAAQPPDSSDNGDIWVDASRPGEGLVHCFIDMSFTIDGSTVVSALSGATGLTTCAPGDQIISLPDGYDQYLSDLRQDWDKLMVDAASVINDGVNDSRVGAATVIAAGDEDRGIVITQIGETVPNGGALLFDEGNASNQYGPNSCLIEEFGPSPSTPSMLTYGQVSYRGGNYEVATTLGPRVNGSACGGGAVLLLDISTEELVRHSNHNNNGSGNPRNQNH